MFLVDRSAFAVLLPLALLVGVVLWSNHSEGRAQAATPPPEMQAARPSQEMPADQTVAANLPSR